MEIQSSIESSDRALQVSSGNLGENWQTDDDLTKRSPSLSQHSLVQAVDEENPLGNGSFRPKERKIPRRSNLLRNNILRMPKRARDELSISISREFPISTRCELNSPRYLEYRQKQKNYKKGAKGAQVWTDEVEEAFHDALRQIKNTGRRPRTFNGKPMGTNELISEFIFQRTGFWRRRKVVSSHLQVLKPFFQDNPEWMAYVTPESNESEKVEHFSINPMKRSESFDVGDGQPSPYLNPLPPPSEIIPSSQRFSIRRINFEMYILGPELEKLHVYTSLQSETGSASKRLEDIPDWQSKFPQMASYYDRGSSHEEIILFETSFKLMNNHPPIKQMGCQAPLRSKLGVDFDVDIDQGSDYMNWECHSNFYEQGVLKESLGTSTKSEDLSSGEARVVVLHLSQWWVNRFTKIIKGRLQKEQAGDLDAMQHDAERARRQIQDVTAIQEIWATPKAGGSSRKRTAVFLWSFRQCQDHEAPTTAWRKVIPPAIKPELYSPIQASAPLFHQPPMVVDTVQRHHDLLQLTPLYAEYFNPQPFYGENSEKFFAGLDSRLGSPSLVPGVDSQSFQSATSDCLPSSIHSSAFPIETPHGSSFGSQEPMLHPEGSVYSLQEMGFNSQDSIYPSQELECPSEEPPTRSSHTPLFTPHAPIESQESSHASQDYYYQMQEGVAQSEETEYPSSVSQCQSDYPRHDSIVNHCNGDMSPPIQDFSGMHIQLSYATPEEEMSTYGTPYIAPPGSMEASQENCHVEYESHSQEELPDHDEGQHQEPLDLEQWQAMDQAVRWANAQFSNGEYEEVGDLLKNSEPVMEGDIGDLQSDIDVELQSGIDVDLPSGIGVELQGVEVDLQSVADVDLGML